MRSQEALRGALLTLIEQKAFETITMRDIAAAASLSYPTAFKHYSGRKELFEDIAKAEIHGFQEYCFPFGAGDDWRPGERIHTYIEQRRNLWRILLTTGAVEAMRSEFIARGRDRGAGRPDLGHGFPLDVVSGTVASGIFEVLAWWLGQEAEIAGDDVADMLETLVIEPALDLPRGFLTGRRGGANGRRR